MKKYPDFYSVLVGPSPGFLLGYIVIAFICAGAIVLYDIGRRDVSSPRTPEKLSFKFWLADNLARIMANFILIPIAIRLCYQYVPPVWMLLLACGIGFGVDGLGMIAKNSGLLTTNKLAQKIKDGIDKV
jgi:hypothetical protein